jgi:hypothetical protein
LILFASVNGDRSFFNKHHAFQANGPQGLFHKTFLKPQLILYCSKQFNPSPSTSKAGAYPSGALFRTVIKTLALRLPTNIRLEWKQ